MTKLNERVLHRACARLAALSQKDFGHLVVVLDSIAIEAVDCRKEWSCRCWRLQAILMSISFPLHSSWDPGHLVAIT